MSRRLPAWTLVAVLCLVAAGFASPLLSTTAAASPYGSQVFQANSLVIPGAQSYSVYSGSTVAQSIFVNETYRLANVTLLVVNNGTATNALNLSVHPDDPTNHVPLMSSVLAHWSEITPNNKIAYGNWTVSPAPLLQTGQTYWLVATNTASQAARGYQWFSTNNDTYAGGRALLYSSGGWSGLPYDLYFVTFGQQYDANVSIGMTADRVQAQPSDFVTFTVRFNNTGSLAAPRVWVNDTLPSALVNTSLSFPGLQPLPASAFPNLIFANVTNGPHDFTLTAQVAIGTPPGTLVTNRVSLTYENATGGASTPGTATAAVLVGLASKQLYMGRTSSAAPLLTTVKPTGSTAQTTTLAPGATTNFLQAPDLASAFHARNVTATLWLGTQHAPPKTYHLNVSLLDNGTGVAYLAASFQITASGAQRYIFAFAVTNYTFAAGHAIGLGITSLGGGSGSTDGLVISYNGTLAPSHLDVVTDTYISIRNLTLQNPNGPTSAWSTLDPLVVRANVSDPFGEARILGVWINITTPSGHLAAAGPMSVLLNDPSALPAWELLGYTLPPPLATGRYRVGVSAVEDNGVTALAQGWATVAIPSFSLANTPSQDRAVLGDTFEYYLDYNNTGSGAAGWVWLNNTLPAGLSFITSNLSVSSVSGSTFTWALQNVSVGPHRLEIEVRVTSATVDWVLDQATLDARDLSAHPLPRLRSNASVFLNGPIISVSLSSLPTRTVHSNETVTYRITLTNSGAAALELWLNNTLPAGFVFNTTTAGTLNGGWTVTGSVVRFNFSNMPANTTWTFDLVATAGPALVRNASYSDSASLAYTSVRDDLMPYALGNLVLTGSSPWIAWLPIRFVDAEVLAGATTPLILSVDNIGSEAASHVWVNLTLDSRLAMVNASTAFAAGPGFARFALTNVGVGAYRIYMNLSVSPNAQDRAILTALAVLDYQDAIGNRLPSTGLSQATILVTTAQILLVVTPLDPMLEVGVATALTVSAYNAGSDTVSNAWLNLTLPTSLQYVNDTFPAAPTVSGSDFTWHWTNQTPGPFFVQIYLEPQIAISNGTSVALLFHLDYQDSTQRLRPAATASVSATVVAPNLVLTVRADAKDVPSGAVVVFTLTMQNRGMTTARSVYLVDAVDSRLLVIIDDASVSSTVTNGSYNWTFGAMPPGMTQVVNLTVRVAGGLPTGAIIPTVFEATYTNSAGVGLGRVRSTPVTITIAADLTVPALIGVGAAGLATFVFVFVWRRKVEIEEVFLVYRDGVLISHLSRTLLREKDEDVLSGMLTAVQEFVREAFQYGEHRDLHQLDFGDYRILIERGKYVFLAVVYSGKESISIRKKVRAVIDRIEHQFGTALENWDGDMEEVIGARDLIRDTLLGSSNHNHAAKQVPESE